jgi:peptide/nickel transport system substrate-binding protein
VLEPADRVRFGVRLRAGDYDVALVSVPWPSASPPLAAAAVAHAVRGPLAARRALAALGGLRDEALAAAAQRTARELDVVPLVATGLRLTRGGAVEGAVADGHGPIDPGGLWRVGGGPLAP